jgi:hypothetical protein
MPARHDSLGDNPRNFLSRAGNLRQRRWIEFGSPANQAHHPAARKITYTQKRYFSAAAYQNGFRAADAMYP